MTLNRRELFIGVTVVVMGWVLSTACQRSARESQCELGKRYLHGIGVQKDVRHAAELFRLSANAGDFRAQGYLATMYLAGNGVPKNTDEGIRLWREVARQPQGILWWKAVAEQGNPEAEYFVGVALLYGGANFPSTPVEGIAWLGKAASQNYLAAQDLLGSCYEKGLGVPQDYFKAVFWFRKAADQGYSEAQHDLAICILKGLGTKKDEAEAVQWFRRSAEQGLSEAQYNLGMAYEKGVGVTPNIQEAFIWYKKAAEQENPLSQVCLGNMYASGHGIPLSVAEAAKWYQRAAKNGYPEADALLANLDFRDHVSTQH